MAPKVGRKDDGGHCASHQHTMAWAERALKHSHCPKSLLSTPRKWKRTSYNNRTKPPSTTFAFPHLSAIHRACQVQSCQGTKENIGLVVVLPRTYPLPVTSTFSHCCQLTSCRVARSSPARKQRKTLGWRWPKSTPASFASLPGHRKHFFHSPQCKPIQKFSHPAPNRGVFQSEPGCKAAANTLFYPSWSAKGPGSLLGDTSNLQ